MRTKLLALSACLISASISAESNLGIDYGVKDVDGSYEVFVVESSKDSYCVEVTIKDISIRDTTLFETKFNTINIGHWPTIAPVGTPALPKFVQNLAMPSNSSKIERVSVEELDWDSFSVGTLLPQQEILCENEKQSVLAIDKDIYKSDSYSPTLAQASEITFFRGIGNVTVSVCPFKYDILGKRLSVLKRFRLNVKFTNDNGSVSNDANGANRNFGHTIFDNIVPGVTDISNQPLGMSFPKKS